MPVSLFGELARAALRAVRSADAMRCRLRLDDVPQVIIHLLGCTIVLSHPPKPNWVDARSTVY